jgi:hypothetical protein
MQWEARLFRKKYYFIREHRILILHLGASYLDAGVAAVIRESIDHLMRIIKKRSNLFLRASNKRRIPQSLRSDNLRLDGSRTLWDGSIPCLMDWMMRETGSYQCDYARTCMQAVTELATLVAGLLFFFSPTDFPFVFLIAHSFPSPRLYFFASEWARLSGGGLVGVLLAVQSALFGCNLRVGRLPAAGGLLRVQAAEC